MIQSEHLSLILSLFPSMAEITEEDWNQEGINVLQMEPNYIIEEGQFLEYVFMILEGTVRMYKISASGREITLYRIHDGECCPLMTSSILGGSEYEASACVETAGLVLIIPAKIFQDWMDRYSTFRQYIFKSLAKRIILLSSLLDSIHFKSIRGRVAEFLVQLADQSGNPDSLHITHDSMSVELGTAREVVSRTLKGLEKEAIIQLSRGKITIINRSALEDYMEL
ncbi:Crp/Fnr family transcriptional regulator [Paenibacillus glycanilyticus]|uniref:Crp/Fnr family transcriptional regulator n=1 Tax=Paenibacillus glycanilyticus TaxID=126569 RepID=UPI00203D2E5A|nr:Crp/Fnr family transcriptional regulator [Paenibacillus glycanilyticus]MCM3629898.1 Crp/Fnr family transcriptional regulator [Paenibacillus glycanilyticus]